VPVLGDDRETEPHREGLPARVAKWTLFGGVVAALLVGTHFLAMETPSYWRTVLVLWSVMGGFALAIGASLCALSALKRSASRELERIYAECGATGAGQGVEHGLVSVRYCTYHGFLGLQYMTRHDARVPPDSALAFLKRLFWFSLKRGIFGWGGVFVPLLCLYHYCRQKSSIEKQIAEIIGVRMRR